MSWYNPADWFSSPDDTNINDTADNEARAVGHYTNSQGVPIGQDYAGADPITDLKLDQGSSWEKQTNELTDDPNHRAGGYAVGGSDPRDYQYGRTAGGADEAANRALGTGNVGMAYGQMAINQATGTAAGGDDFRVQAQNNATRFDARGAPVGNWRTQNETLGQLGGLETQQGPSAAQSQLQQGTNQALSSQLALARSGSGFGGNAASAGLAQSNMAGLQANQVNQAAALAAQENAAWRGRQAQNLNSIAGMQGQQSQANLGAAIQGQAQNDAMFENEQQRGQNAYFQGRAAQQQSYGMGVAGVGQALAGQGLAHNVRESELGAGASFEDNQLRHWAAENGYELAQQQRSDQKDAAAMSAGATIGAAALMASDVRGKTRVALSRGAGEDFARGFDGGGLGFDGSIYRPRGAPQAEGGNTPADSSSMTPMQQKYMGGADQPSAGSETTQLSPEQESAFQGWAKKNKIGDVDHPDSHYDYRGYFKEYGSQPHQQGAHFTDEFKQHGHPTFSIESNYSKGFDDGGYWEGDKYNKTAAPDRRPIDTDALDASASDAVRNSPASFYDYKDPGAPGADAQRHYGPMAQDLLKTPAGASAVTKMPDGKLGVDTGRLALVQHGAISEQQKKIDELSAQLDAITNGQQQQGYNFKGYAR